MADGVHTPSSLPQDLQSGNLLQASELAAALALKHAPNGLSYASFGDIKLADSEVDRIVQAVPSAVSKALSGRAFYFVPLALPEGESRGPSDRTVVSPVYTSELSDEAICHRVVQVAASAATPAHEGIFISARLLRDTFALAFELFINVGHIFAGEAGIPEAFAALAWSQATADVRGETSQDAWESRRQALGPPGQSQPDEKAKGEFLESAFADALAIYLLSLAVDFDYSELREREYPLLAPASLAERLRLIAQLFPPNPGYEFSIRYRRR
jgi:hypothetical protein